MKMPTLNINGKIAKFPIIQGGMGIGISLHRLATACIKEGIVGTLSAAQVGYRKNNHLTNNMEANFTAIAEEVLKVREECPNGILGVNLMHATQNYDQYAKFLGTLDIDFVVSGAGLPVDLPRFLEGSNVKPAVIVSSGKAAKLICARWYKSFNQLPEFIVVEGPLAGGHLGFSKEEMFLNKYKSLEELVVEVKEAIGEYELIKHIPIIAAGGVHTGSDIKNYIELGCDGVQMATRFITTHECDASDAYKQKLIDAKEEDVVLVPSPVGLPGRAIRNTFTELVSHTNIPIKRCVNCLKPCAKINIPYCITEKLSGAVSGDTDNGLVFTGAKAYLINKMQTVNELVYELTSELEVI